VHHIFFFYVEDIIQFVHLEYRPVLINLLISLSWMSASTNSSMSYKIIIHATHYFLQCFSLECLDEKNIRYQIRMCVWSM